LIVASDYIPSTFVAFTGGSPNTLYELNLSAEEIEKTLTVETVNRDNYYGYPTVGNCTGYDPPSSQIFWYAIGNADSYHTPGDVLDIDFGVYELKEKSDTIAACGDCSDIVGKAEYYNGSTLQNITFTINGSDIPVSSSTTYGPLYNVQIEAPENTGYLNLRFDYEQSVYNRDETEDDCYCTTEEFQDSYIQTYLALNPLVIEMESAVSFSVDEVGNNLCDTEISYTISPEDYDIQIGALSIFEDGVLFAEYPLNTETLDPVIISQGVQFNLTKTYTASVSVNSYGDEQFDGTSSEAVELSLQQDVSIQHLYVENEKENVPVMQGKSVTMLAETNPANLATQLEWSVYALHEKRAAEEQILVDIDKETGELTVYENSGSGKVMVRASYNDCIYKEEIVEIGCQSCESGSCPVMGASSDDLGSVDFTISLGNTTGGDNAGSLTLQIDNISTYAYTVKSLKYS
jgi:hypothetical protein